MKKAIICTARTLCGDLKKLFGSYSIYLCMVGLGVIYIVMYFASLSAKSYTFGIVNAFESVQGNEVALVSFLLSIVGGSFLYCTEEKRGYLVFEIQRVGVGVYTTSKLLVSVIGGFCTVIIGYCIYMVGVLTHFYAMYGQFSSGGEDWEHFLWYWLVSALRCSMLSAIGFLVSTYVPNYFVAMTVPILIYYTILIVEGYIQMFFPFISTELFFTDRYFVGLIEGERFGITLLYTLFILIVMHGMARKCIERRMEHA